MTTAVTAVNAADGSYTTRSTISTVDVPVGAELAGPGVNALVTRSFEQSFTATGAAIPQASTLIDAASMTAEQQQSGRALVDAVSMISVGFPAEPVAVGAAWTSPGTVGSHGSVIPVTYQCRLTALDASTYTMEVSYTQSFSLPSDAGAIEATVAGTGTHRRIGVEPVGRLRHAASDDRRDPGCRTAAPATRRSPSTEPAGSVVTTDSSAVLVERDGDIVTITLDRPEKRNALAVDVMEAVTAAFATHG